MRKLTVLCLLLVGLALGCGPRDDSGDDDDDNDDNTGFTLADGTYTASNAAVPQDDCGLGVVAGDINGTTVTVTATDSVVTIDFGNGPLTLNRTGNNFTVTTPSQIDLNPQGFDCLLDSSDVLDGILTAIDNFGLTETLTVSENSGTECGNVGITFPCVSQITVDYAP